MLDSRYEHLTDTERRAKPSSVALMVSAADTLVRYGVPDLAQRARAVTEIDKPLVRPVRLEEVRPFPE